MTKELVCPDCGKVHPDDGIFPLDLIKIYHDILKCENPETREALFLRLAMQFSDMLSGADVSFPEELHFLTEKFFAAQAEESRAAMKLARGVFSFMNEVIEETSEEKEKAN